MNDAYAKTVHDVLGETRSHLGGLSQAEAKVRLEKYGPNQLPAPLSSSIFSVFARQFKNPLIYILLLVGVISLFTGHTSDAGFILGILILNAAIGTIQEYGAEKSSLALRNISKSRCVVSRDDENFEIDSTELVIGDIVQLESGNKIPADLRLISSHGLEIDESLLTGESIATQKNADAKISTDLPLGDRVTMAFAGALVTRGRASGVVTGTGLNSELGKIADTVLTSEAAKTPLILRMEKFTKNLALFFSIAVAVIAVMLVIRGQPLVEVLVLAAALGVAAIPEGLPIALTVALAIASRRMARRSVIVRSLTSVEALGSCTFIGTDKTGTLTQNKLTVKVVAFPDQPSLEILEAAPAVTNQLLELSKTVVLCNEAVLSNRDGEWVSHGDAVDIALLMLAHKSGITAPKLDETYRQIGQIPFESENQFSATLHSDDQGQQYISVKGAFEKLLPFCGADNTKIGNQASDLAAQGFRVLAVAVGKPDKKIEGHLTLSHLKGLRFLGLVGMIDPPRPEALEAIRSSRDAGIEIAMITGDHPITALAIARELGLAEDESEVITGITLKAAKNEAEFDALVKRAKVFARMEPTQKLLITESLKRQGHFVAVTGDGANDAPALKAAHVGVAMGKSGTDVAKETSDLIIADDRFSSLIAGIEEGRIAYSNIRKVIYLLISTGIAEIVLIVLCVGSGMPIPLTAIQLLWLNLVSEGIQGVALAFEPKEGDELKLPPRNPNEPIFNRLMLERVILSAVVMGGISYLVFSKLLKSGMEFSTIQNHILLLMVLFENVLVANARSETKSAITQNIFRNPLLLFGTLAALGLHFGAMHFEPAGKVLGTYPILTKDWLFYLALAASVFLVIEIQKLIRRFLIRTEARR